MTKRWQVTACKALALTCCLGDSPDLGAGDPPKEGNHLMSVSRPASQLFIIAADHFPHKIHTRARSQGTNKVGYVLEKCHQKQDCASFFGWQNRAVVPARQVMRRASWQNVILLQVSTSNSKDRSHSASVHGVNIRTVTKLVSLIQQIDKQYEILSDIQADGDTGGFTAVCLGCFVGDKNSKSL